MERRRRRRRRDGEGGMRTTVWSRRAADLPHDLLTGAAADLVGLALGHAAGVERAVAVTDPLVAHALLLLGSIVPKLLLLQQFHMESWIPSHLLALRLWIVSSKGAVHSQTAEVDQQRR
jgi:hypothetical protein